MNQSPKISRSSVLNLMFMGLLLFVLFNTNAKSWVLEKLISAGIFKPDLEQQQALSQPGDIAFESADGKVLKLSELRGKVVFLNFWATWCPPCRAEMPSMEKLYQEFKDDKKVTFLMVNIDDGMKKAQNFMKKKKYNLPVYVPASAIPKTILGNTIPTTVIFSPSGRMVLNHVGAGNFSSKEVIDFIARLSKE